MTIISSYKQFIAKLKFLITSSFLKSLSQHPDKVWSEARKEKLTKIKNESRNLFRDAVRSYASHLNAGQ